jgi:hypothetical protein
MPGRGYWKLPIMADEHLKLDHCRRVAFWQLCFDKFPIRTPKAEYFNNVYQGALTRARIGLGLSEKNINEYYQYYMNVFKYLL